MITKVCIDNFRCFQKFELELSPLCLLLGDNGSGKTSFFDVLSGIQSLVGGRRVGDCFSRTDWSKLGSRREQDFAVDLVLDEGAFRYELRVWSKPGDRKERVAYERLLLNSRVIYEIEDGRVQLYQMSGSDVAPGATFPFDSTMSFLPLLEGDESQPLFRFRDAVRRWRMVDLVPSEMDPVSTGESRSMLPSGRDFSSWYRSLVTDQPEVVSAANRSLQSAIQGFEQMRFVPVGPEAKVLEVAFAASTPYSVPFNRLSNGQRVLIVLHTLMQAARRLGYDLFIDEPDNFISLREMQGLAGELEDLYLDDKQQVVLVSHHPEFVNSLAETHGIFFTRPDNGPVKARIGYPVFEGLTAAETMARGWDDEEE